MVIYKLGSQGEDIRQLQEQLNKNGYNLATNGIYDEQTQAAEKDYRAKKGNVTSGGANIKAGPVTIEYRNQGYDPNSNPDYVNAMSALEQVNKSAPTYNPSFDAQLEEMYNKIVNREDFKYDLNADALYEQYQDRFANMGQMAMQDTMGQAAALTGGYGSSYAQNAGQQAYNQYLAQLNDIVPELYAQAYGRYQDEGQALMQQYGMLGDMADREYAMYMDQYNQWLAQQQMAREDADTAYNRGWNDFINAQQMQYQKDRDAVADAQWDKQFEYGREQDDRAYQQWLKQFQYGQEQDAIANSQWEQQFQYGKEQDNIAYQQWLKEMAYQKEQDAIANQQWDKQFQYGQQMDDRAYQQWLQQMQYQKEQDAIANQQWQDAFDLEKAQWEWQKQQAGLKATQSSGGTTYIPEEEEEEKVSQAIKEVSSNAASNYNPSGSVFASGLAAGLAGPAIAQNKGNTTTKEDSWAVKEAKRNGGSTVEGQLRYLEQMKKRGQISESQLQKFAEELVGK